MAWFRSARRNLTGQRLLYPWEGRAGIRRRLHPRRIRPYLGLLLGVGFLLLVAVRERRASGVRQTRARIIDTRRAIDAYLAESDGGCPTNLEAVLPYSKLKEVPRDAWSRPLRLRCPGRREGSAYELMSDGPDGLPGGLDRIE